MSFLFRCARVDDGEGFGFNAQCDRGLLHLCRIEVDYAGKALRCNAVIVAEYLEYSFPEHTEFDSAVCRIDVVCGFVWSLACTPGRCYQDCQHGSNADAVHLDSPSRIIVARWAGTFIISLPPHKRRVP